MSNVVQDLYPEILVEGEGGAQKKNEHAKTRNDRWPWLELFSVDTEQLHESDRTRSTLDHLDPVSAVMICCTGPVSSRSNPGNMR